MKTMNVSIENKQLSFEIHGETLVGNDEVLLAGDDDLTLNTNFHESGYDVLPFLDAVQFATLKEGITKLIARYLAEAGVTGLEQFDLVDYHKYASTNDIHFAVVSKIQNGIDISEFPLDPALLEQRVESIVGFPVTSRNRYVDWHAFSIRIIRPNMLTDNNPPHRDVWLDRLRNAINIYVPFSGSDKNSALPILPGSHLWKESEIERTAQGAKINDIAYTVPCVVGSKHGLSMIRPNPGENEFLIFSPYLIHGGGYNLNTDTTRVSLEMRFWRKDAQ